MNRTYELYHHGILGMKWGIRRYQNKDGSLTEAGKKRLERKALKRDGGEYQKKETEFNKEMVIAKGDYEKAVNHMEVFTEQELDTIINRAGKAAKLRDFKVSELAKERDKNNNDRRDRYNKFVRVVGYVEGAAKMTTQSLTFYNNIAKAANTFFDADMKVVNVGGGDNNKK